MMNHLATTRAASLKPCPIPSPLVRAVGCAIFCATLAGCGGNVEITGGGPGPDGTGGTGSNPGRGCEQAATDIIATYTGCGIEIASPPDGEPVECTPELGAQSTCVANCTADATCETLKGEDQDGAVAYAECLGGC